MRRSSTYIISMVAVLLVAAPALAQVFVYPRRPNKSHMRYQDFEWHYVDIRRGKNARGEAFWQSGPRLHATSPGILPTAPSWVWPESQAGPQILRDDQQAGAGGPTIAAATKPRPGATDEPAADREGPPERRPGGPSTQAEKQRFTPDWSQSGGVRLYFYERERQVAERAAAAIAESYEELVGHFQYVPTRTVPYFLYNTYQEFLQTNVFPVQEGVLGVTGTKGLEMALPYFGDYRQFIEVSTHELVHQFTLQKLAAVAERAEVDESLVEPIPLWYVEGLAEFYAQEGLDAETRMLMRDLVLNPDAGEGYAMPGFFVEPARSYLGTYKLGQTRCVFLEETYGQGTLQRILERSYRLVDSPRSGGPRAIEFERLVELITGDEADVIDLRFHTWLKQRAFRSFLLARHQPESLTHLDHVDGGVQAMSSSPEGTLIAYRSVNQNTGGVTLALVDHRRSDEPVQVARDGKPGVESLHPIAGRNFALSRDVIAFVALHRDGDVIYWQPYERRARRVMDEDTKRKRWEVDIDLGTRRRIDLGGLGVVAADELAFSPDGARLAFIGVSIDGQKDVYVLEHDEAGKPGLRQITDDLYAEQDLTWGQPGLVYTSDATEHGRYNLFLVGPDDQRRRLTREARDHFDPAVLADGRIVFVAFDHIGANVYEVMDADLPSGVDGGLGEVDGAGTDGLRRSRVATGLLQPAPGPGEGMWVLHYFRGGRRVARLRRSSFLSELAPRGSQGPVPAMDRLPILGARRYSALSWKSWQVDGVFGILGVGGDTVVGQVVAQLSDRLRNHALSFNMIAYGSWELIDGTLFYTNQEHRAIWGAGLFQDINFRLDTTFEDDGLLFLSAERFFGAAGIVRYPLDQFRYMQAKVMVGGLGYGLSNDVRTLLAAGELNGTGRDLAEEWQAQHDDIAMHSEVSLSAGYNTLRYHRATGPIAGSSALVEATAAVQPFDGEAAGTLRLDAEHYIPLAGRINILMRGGVGQSFGGRLARNFYLSSFDTLRGVTFGDPELLLGRSFWFTTAELQLPLEWLVQVSLLDLEGIAGVDVGGVGPSPEGAWDSRVLDGVLGANIGFSWLVLRLHFAKPLDIGGRVLPQQGDWNMNFSLAYRYQ